MKPQRNLALGFLACIALAGCGGDKYSKAVVTGRVTCNDKPAWGGVITFQPVDAPSQTGRPAGNPGGVSRGIVQEDGTFRLTYEARGANGPEDGAIIGPHRITFILPMTEPQKWSPQDDWMPEEEKIKRKAEMASQQVYPALECGAELDVAEVEVKAGSNEFEFKLKAGKPKGPARPSGSD